VSIPWNGGGGKRPIASLTQADFQMAEIVQERCAQLGIPFAELTCA
jgi:hypothetical protein